MAAKNVLILGIGNILWADEGFGVRAVEALNRDYQFADNVTLMDGGTQGIYLVQHVQKADVLVVFDAIDYGLAPGTMKLIYNEEVPKFMGAKQMSLHQTGFQEVLALADFTGDYPQDLFLIGVQPVELEDFGGSLREPVRAQLAPAVEQALAYLAQFDVVPQRRAVPLAKTTLAPDELGLAEYEAGRPTEQDACRIGDVRVLNQSLAANLPDEKS